MSSKLTSSHTYLAVDPQWTAKTERIFFSFLAHINMLINSFVDLPRDSQVISTLREASRTLLTKFTWNNVRFCQLSYIFVYLKLQVSSFYFRQNNTQNRLISSLKIFAYWTKLIWSPQIPKRILRFSINISPHSMGVVFSTWGCEKSSTRYPKYTATVWVLLISFATLPSVLGFWKLLLPSRPMRC